ncbi:hypothetical protein JOM56_007048 [Amanita muscaria]
MSPPSMETHDQVFSYADHPAIYSPCSTLTDRDFEVEKVIRAIHTQIQRRTSITGSHEQGPQSMDEERSATLQQENSLGSALALFKLRSPPKSTLNFPWKFTPGWTPNRRRRAGLHRMPGDLGSRSGLSGGAEAYVDGLESDDRHLFMGWYASLPSTPSTDSWSSSVMDVPQPASSPFTPAIGQQHSPARTRSIVDAVGGVAWSVMIESLASSGMIAKLDDAFERTLTNGANDSLAQTFTQRVTMFAANMKRMQDLATSDVEHKLTFLVDEMMHVNNDIRKRFAMVRAV